MINHRIVRHNQTVNPICHGFYTLKSRLEAAPLHRLECTDMEKIMKHDTKLTAQIEPQNDLYYAIHKALRLANAEMLILIGQTDANDEASVTAMIKQLRAHLDICAKHLNHEDTHIHSALDARSPGATGDADEDHSEHHAVFNALDKLAHELENSMSGKPMLLRRLYQRFALFFAADLEHMHCEETEVMPAIARNFTPVEAQEIKGRIIASITPDELVATTRLMLKAASQPERREMLRDMQASMPTEAFEEFMGQVTRIKWRVGDIDELERAIC